jgi:rhodanese-related sulfurtransferase
MKKILGIIVCVLIMSVSYSIVDAKKRIETPTVLDGGRIITAEETKTLMENKSAFFFDMRKAINFGKSHIPTAVSTPYSWHNKDEVTVRTGEFDMSRLPADKNATIVFYSDGPTGWKSYKASQDAIKAGYKNVLYFRGGFSTWDSKGYPVEH